MTEFEFEIPPVHIQFTEKLFFFHQLHRTEISFFSFSHLSLIIKN